MTTPKGYRPRIPAPANEPATANGYVRAPGLWSGALCVGGRSRGLRLSPMKYIFPLPRFSATEGGIFPLSYADNRKKPKKEIIYMKKLFCVILAVLTVLTLCACGAKSGASPVDEMPLEDIMENILAGVELPAVGNIDIDETNFSAYLFTDAPAEYEAIASEAMISAIAHSVVLVRVPDNAAALEEAIRSNLNPAKWICVEAEKTDVVRHGNTILLVMSSTDTVDAIVSNFDKLAG